MYSVVEQSSEALKEVAVAEGAEENFDSRSVEAVDVVSPVVPFGLFD